MRYGDKGDDVRLVQQQLLRRGYTLPAYGADGVLGDESWSALELYAKSELGKKSWNPEVPEEVLVRLGGAPLPVDPEPSPLPEPADGITILDLRSEQTDPAPKSKVVGGRTVKRAPHTITGITLHQTACTYGVSQQQIDAAGGDRELALHRRALNVACHAMAFRDGTVVVANELESYIYHGNGLNAASLGCEVAGIYPGKVNEPEKTTWGGEPTELTELTIATAREAVRTLVEMGRAQGMAIDYLYGHRQASSSRRADPGEGLWRSVALWAQSELGLKLAQNITLGDGYTIPKEWDPNGVGSY
tara:strand:- start:17 stop:925 length:909 start_codon:yes stop_codon:yes gene_type:complete